MPDKQLRFDIGPIPIYFVPDVWQQYGKLLAAHDQEEGPASIDRLRKQLTEKLRGKNVRFKRIETQIQWAWGDWLLQGEAGGMKQKQLKEEALRISGYEWGTLKNFKSIAKRFEASRRRDGLTWSHHAMLAPLDDKMQDELLDKAVQEEFSRGQLSNHFRKNYRGDWWWNTPYLKIRPRSRSEYELLVALAKARKVSSPDLLMWKILCEYIGKNKDAVIAEAATIPEFKERIEELDSRSHVGGPNDNGAHVLAVRLNCCHQAEIEAENKEWEKRFQEEHPPEQMAELKERNKLLREEQEAARLRRVEEFKKRGEMPASAK
jgi:hypothetical protein